MAESVYHITLVKCLAKMIADTFLEGDYSYILIDTPDRCAQDKPPIINGYVPDVYVMNTTNLGVIIGEAKTTEDSERSHSIEQYEAFIQYCRNSKGSNLILAVPWHQVRNMRSILRRLKKKLEAQDVNTIVIDKLPG